MADELVESCRRLRIVEEENEVVDLGAVESTNLTAKTSLMLVGKVLSTRAVNLDALKRVMTQIWSLNSNMVVRAIDSNSFIFQFFHWKDKAKILDGRPWLFDQKLLVIDEILGDTQPSDVVLETSPFWVRIYNLPFNCRSDTEVRAIAGGLGPVLEVDIDDFGLERFCRVKVELNIFKPLRRRQRIRRKDGAVASIDYKYERLPHFCFRCGVLGHGDKDCNAEVPEEWEKEMGWGQWLKASPYKGRGKHKEETGAIKERRRVLFVCKEEGDFQGEKNTQLGNRGEGIYAGRRQSSCAVAEIGKGINVEQLVDLGNENYAMELRTEGDKSINEEVGATHIINAAGDVSEGDKPINNDIGVPHFVNVADVVTIPEDQHNLSFQVGTCSKSFNNSKLSKKKRPPNKGSVTNLTKSTPMDCNHVILPAVLDTGPSDVDFLDVNFMGKRKCADFPMDTMLDLSTGRKKSKIELNLDQNMIQVAEVGVAQPREEQ
uniref:CCHC-type domain-containing protein n=1 Tax=Beta vulgaris subsp. vulgaris TaxID=3555 RepID=F4NCI6_BETVV|nr:hypothetical protein [Beta vulgaris subsp. vulgaris]